MTIEPLVEGPAWTGFGIQESAGRYPLRVETAVSNVVGRLLPGVITTTRHARMYAIHCLGWAAAGERELDRPGGEALIRRMEVVATAIHHLHDHHRIELSSAHGEGEVSHFLSDGRLDLAAAAQSGGMSRNGFAGVYHGPCVAIGGLTDEAIPRPGERSDVAQLREALSELLTFADQDHIPEAELRSAGHLCLCEAAAAPDGRWLRRVLAGEPSNAQDRNRQLTCGLLLDTLHGQPSQYPEAAFRDRWAFGPPEGSPEHSERAMVAALWRAAGLRNFSVAAWRALWRWLTDQLNADPMTAQHLGDRLADALDDLSVDALFDELPDRMDGDNVLRAELELSALDWTPTRAVRELALGARRLDDLGGPTLKAFVGTDSNDLGPRWVQGLLGEAAGRHVRDVGRELAVILVRRAQRVALSKMYLTRDGHPFVPTRLRDRDGVLSVYGQEGAGDVALRIGSLADVLAGAGLIDLGDHQTYAPSERGEALRVRLA